MGMIRWVTAGLGAIFGGGILGGVIGYAAGSLLEGLVRKEYDNTPKPQADFVVSLLILTSAVMRADGKVMKSELSYVKTFFSQQVGEEETLNRLKILRSLLDKEINLPLTCRNIRFALEYSERLNLLHYLFGLANADGNISQMEIDTITQIASMLGLSEADYKTIEAIYFSPSDSAYTILQIDKSATDEQVKKAYRRLAVKYHPDKVSELSQDAQKLAKEKFQDINNAYERVKKERGIS
jgi:DnaJ-class molecular chaperone with C-terminal Zn finger domain